MNSNDDVAASTPEQTVRRPAGSRFVPRAPEAEAEAAGQDLLVQRSVLHSAHGKPKPLTQRERAIAGDLPDWEPMPPGELVVKRGA